MQILRQYFLSQGKIKYVFLQTHPFKQELFMNMSYLKATFKWSNIYYILTQLLAIYNLDGHIWIGEKDISIANIVIVSYN